MATCSRNPRYDVELSGKDVIHESFIPVLAVLRLMP